MKRPAAYAAALLAFVALAAMLYFTRSEETPETDSPGQEAVEDGGRKRARPGRAAARDGEDPETDGQAAEEAEEEEEMPDSGVDAETVSDEERAETEEERRVEEFDGAVDRWMEPKEGRQVAMSDVDAFRESFNRVPQPRKEECLQRALNLVPDENVMLLAGILFDKTQDAALLDLVYNDILNRDESVKTPILRELFKDREHPNWADTAWVLEMTGSLPNGEKDGGE